MQYSINAIPQETRMAFHSGHAWPYFKCPYQAMVMKTLEPNNSRIVIVKPLIVISRNTATHSSSPFKGQRDFPPSAPACTIASMLRIAFALLALSVATSSQGAEPVLDNDRVTVWDTTAVLPPAQHDFVAVSLVHKGTAHVGHQSEAPGVAGERTVLVELKDHAPPPSANTGGYPPAFPRPPARKVLEKAK